eukprot:1139069-Pelagomonas_calceolata.AAC.4
MGLVDFWKHVPPGHQKKKKKRLRRQRKLSLRQLRKERHIVSKNRESLSPEDERGINVDRVVSGSMLLQGTSVIGMGSVNSPARAPELCEVLLISMARLAKYMRILHRVGMGHSCKLTSGRPLPGGFWDGISGRVAVESGKRRVRASRSMAENPPDPH